MQNPNLSCESFTRAGRGNSPSDEAMTGWGSPRTLFGSYLLIVSATTADLRMVSLLFRVSIFSWLVRHF